jgi:hypothetical protein
VPKPKQDADNSMTCEIEIYFTTDTTGILKKLGMYEDAETGRLRCYFCGRSVNLQNIGGIFKHERQVRVVCGDIKCLYEAAWLTSRRWWHERVRS